MVVSSPASAKTYMFSVAASELVFALPPIAILLGVVAFSSVGVTALAVAEIIVIMLLTWITTSSIGFFLSTYVLNTRTAFLTVSFISILISVLPPVFYSINAIPAQLRWLAELAPTTHSSLLIQSAMSLPTSFPQLELSWVALPTFTVIFLLLALYKARWREG
jgi:ABC-2 type transport system permease protein